MTPRDLIADFEVLAEAPDGVKRLRELVLQLAISGKLVGKWPASEDVGKDEGNQLPLGWRYASLGDLLADGPTNGWSPKAVDHPTPVKTLKLSATTRGVFDPSHFKYVDAENAIDSRLWLEPGDLLVQRSNTPEYVGMAAVYFGPRQTFIYPDLMMRCRVCPDHSVKFIHLALLAPATRSWMRSHANGTSQSMVKVNQATVAATPIPLPPLAEQHRIVARVDELMALLDRLEAARETREAQRRAARDSALAALRDAEDAEAVEAAWQRIAGQMETLFAGPEDVRALRQVVLQLAVRGKLTKQDASDGCPEFGTRSKDIGSRIPLSWNEVKLANVAEHIVDGTHFTPSYVEDGIPFISAKDLVDGAVSFERCRRIPEAEYKELCKRCQPKRGDVLLSKSGTIGRVAVVDTDRPFTLFESVALVPVLAGMASRFVAFVVQVEVAGEFGQSRTKGAAVQHLHLKELRQLPVPVPPLAEQHRIVAKVDALMALCDQLEARLKTARDLQASFAASAAHHLDL